MCELLACFFHAVSKSFVSCSIGLFHNPVYGCAACHGDRMRFGKHRATEPFCIERALTGVVILWMSLEGCLQNIGIRK